MRHKRLTLHQKQWCVHASANDSSVQQSASSRHSTGGETASASQNGGVSPASPEESVAKGTKTDTATHDVNGVSNVEKAAKKSAVAHQVRLTKASDWHQEAAEEEAYTKWVPLVQEKQRELPLVAGEHQQ